MIILWCSMIFLWWGIPTLIGFICGYFFSIPINIALGSIAVLFSIYGLWSTRNAELGVLLGWVTAIVSGIFCLSLLITTLVVNGASMNIDLGWMFR